VTRHTAKRKLKDLGLTVSGAAIRLGVSREHLSRVLNGRRDSRRILDAIESISTSN